MHFRSETEKSVAAAVVEAVGLHEGVPVESLPPLEDSINTDLDELFDSGGDWAEDRRIDHLTFEYADHYVTIDSEGSISVERKPEDPFSL